MAGVPSSRSGPRMAFGWAGPRIGDRSGLKFGAGAPVYLAAVQEYLCAELEELSGGKMKSLPSSSESAGKAESEGEGEGDAGGPPPAPPSIALSVIKEDEELLRSFSPLGGLDAGFQLLAPRHRRLELVPEQGSAAADEGGTEAMTPSNLAAAQPVVKAMHFRQSSPQLS